MNNDWDAETYARDFSFVPSYGKDVMRLIDWQDDLRILDLGCGTGALTAELAERGARVVGMDASPEMLSVARRTHPDLCFLQGDATSFSLDEPVDVVFSNAVLHWIDREKHPQMLRCVTRALVEGGQFVFECGGRGNNAFVHTALRHAYERRGMTYMTDKWFPGAFEYTALLENAGFEVDTAYLISRMTPLEGDDGMARWLRMFQHRQLEATGGEQDDVMREVLDELEPKLYIDGTWFADYVRLRVSARLRTQHS